MRSRFFLLFLIVLSACSGKKYTKNDGDSLFVVSGEILADRSLGGYFIDVQDAREHSCTTGSDCEPLNASRNHSYNGDFSVKNSQNLGFFGKKNDLNFSLAPVICNDKYYFIDSNGVLKSYSIIADSKLEKSWEVNINESKQEKKGFRSGYIRLDGDVIFVSANNGIIASYNCKNGQEIWRKNLRTGFHSSVGAKDGKLYIQSSDSKVLCLDAKTGEIVWEKKFDSKNISSFEIAPILLHGDIAIACLSDGRVVFLNSNNGDIIWESKLFTTKISGNIVDISDIDYVPVIVGNVLIVGGINSVVLGIDIRNRMPIWMIETELYSNIIHNGKDFAFFLDKESRLIGVHTLSGKVKWINKDMPAFYKERKQPYLNKGNEFMIKYISRYYPSFLNGNIAILDMLGNFRLFDTNNGSLVSTFETTKLVSSGFAVNKGRIFMQDEWNNVYVL